MEELDIVTGKYTLVYKFPWAEANAFAFLDKNDDGEMVSDVHDLDDDDQDADARPDVRAAAAATAARDAARDAVVDLFLRLLRGAHDGADHGDVESNGDGSPDTRGDVRTDARHGGAVLRADDGHLCAIGRADGHGAALAFGSADRRADAADSLDGETTTPARDGVAGPLLLIPPPRITPLTITQGPSC